MSLRLDGRSSRVSLQQCCQDKGAKVPSPHGGILDIEEVETCTWVLINLNNKLGILGFILILVYIGYPGYHLNQSCVNTPSKGKQS